jgi:aryl-alcohol dehydrogenase-like predicted oxidoreductase
MTELILGTAQFGAGYGITNTVGRIADDDMAAILAEARTAGIDLFDTAPDYGDAQRRLGELADANTPRRFVSKFGLPEGGAPTLRGDTLFASSLSDLRVSSLYGLLFHRVADLRDDRASAAWDSLRSARESGTVARIGASIYDADDLAIAVERFPDLNLIQIPANIVDRRLLDHPTLRSLHDRGVEVHVRSAYLQGLLLTSPDGLPPHFNRLRPIVAQLRAVAAERGSSVMAAALGFLRDHPVVDAVLVGALNAGELSATVAAWREVAADATSIELPSAPADLLDPRDWPPRGTAQ